MNNKIEIRRWECPYCNGKFWVDCDDNDYPNYCPHCSESNYQPHDEDPFWIQTFIRSSETVFIYTEKDDKT